VEFISATKVRIFVLHEQVAAHYIGAIWITNARNEVIGFLDNLPTDGTSPVEAAFDLPAGEFSVTPYTWCNKHNVWKNDQFVLPGMFGNKIASLVQVCKDGACPADTPNSYSIGNFGSWASIGVAKEHMAVVARKSDVEVLLSLFHSQSGQHYIDTLWISSDSGQIINVKVRGASILSALQLLFHVTGYFVAAWLP